MEIFKIERGRLNEWVKFVPGSEDEKRGKRLIKNFNKNDLYAIGLFKILIEAGVSRKTAAGIADTWKEEFSKKDYLLFRRGSDGVLTLESINHPKGGVDRAIILITTSLLHTFEENDDWNLAYILNMRKIKKDIDEKVQELSN